MACNFNYIVEIKVASSHLHLKNYLGNATIHRRFYGPRIGNDILNLEIHCLKKRH